MTMRGSTNVIFSLGSVLQKRLTTKLCHVKTIISIRKLPLRNSMKAARSNIQRRPPSCCIIWLSRGTWVNWNQETTKYTNYINISNPQIHMHKLKKSKICWKWNCQARSSKSYWAVQKSCGKTWSKFIIYKC